MGDEVGAGHVEVGEVGAVGLVEVVVRLEQGVAGRGYAVVEEGAGRERAAGAEGVEDEGVEDAGLYETHIWMVSKEVEGEKGGKGGRE